MTPTDPTAPKYRTITLSDRAPVRIREDEWPVIAVATEHDGQIEAQANRRYGLRVRQHADGRAIVYGVKSTQFQHERAAAAGELLDPGADLVAAIRRVAVQCGCDRLVPECIADLPAEDLTR